MALTAKQILQMNRMNRAAQNASLGTLVGSLEGTAGQISSAFTTGSYTAVAADASASRMIIATGATGIAGFLVQVYTSGSLKSTIKVISSGSNLTVSAGSAVSSTIPAIAAGDVANWIVY